MDQRKYLAIRESIVAKLNHYYRENGGSIDKRYQDEYERLRLWDACNGRRRGEARRSAIMSNNSRRTR